MMFLRSRRRLPRVSWQPSLNGSSEIANSLPGRRVPENVRAYDLFLQGNHLTDAFAPEAQARAEALFEQALQIDPGFARAHTGLAWIYRNRSEEFAVGVPRAKDAIKVKALHEAEQALALDPNDARVHF